LRDDASHRVAAAAGRVRHDQRYGTDWIALGGAGHTRAEDESNEQRKDLCGNSSFSSRAPPIRINRV